MIILLYSSADVDMIISNGLLPILSSLTDVRKVPPHCISQVAPNNIQHGDKISLFGQATACRLLQILAISAGCVLSAYEYVCVIWCAHVSSYIFYC